MKQISSLIILICVISLYIFGLEFCFQGINSQSTLGVFVGAICAIGMTYFIFVVKIKWFVQQIKNLIPEKREEILPKE